MAVTKKKTNKTRLFWSITRRRRRRPSSVTKHYLQHRDLAKEMILARLHYWNQFYGFSYNRVTIRNQKTCWGSCTSLRNLNFSYKIIFLPTHLQDYVVLHELCHLKELHHGQSFWDEMGKMMPDYAKRMNELRQLESKLSNSLSGFLVQ
ncbi:M48 family metallopeptidase [Candidatus Kaiserbacteria bacterium]|nr:M48 family metallopeptidase [Candidatus Kaiserbacteria bacterium]